MLLTFFDCLSMNRCDGNNGEAIFKDWANECAVCFDGVVETKTILMDPHATKCLLLLECLGNGVVDHNGLTDAIFIEWDAKVFGVSGDR